MTTDDAKTVGAQTCQLESWYETTRTSKTHGIERERKMVASPACGIGESIELNVELIRSLPTDDVRLRSTLALKWVDASWKLDGLSWGLKFWRATAHTEDPSSRQPEATGSSGLMSWEASNALTLHANFGFERDHASRHTNRLANLALDWAATERLHWFAEALHVDHQPMQFNTGVRWWLASERLALDVTTGQGRGFESQRRFSIGLGWYGFGW